MWQDDEDNNPYGSYSQDDNPTLGASCKNTERRTSTAHTDEVIVHEQASTPPSSQPSPNRNPAFLSRVDNNDNDNDDEEEERDEPRHSGILQRKDGYDGRVQQIIYENPDLEILITDAGKSADGGYIVYRIRTGDIEVARRYSEFASLRTALVSLHPTLVVPPIPEKHTMADYAAKPTKAKEDAGIIDQRKRMLAVFLNRCRRMPEVLEDGVYWRFLDPNSSWNQVLQAHPVASVPKSNLKAPPLDPANPTQAHNWLPVPPLSAKLKSPVASQSAVGTPVSQPEQSQQPSTTSHAVGGSQVLGRFPLSPEQLSESELDPYFVNFESATKELELLLQGSIEKVNRRTLEHLAKFSADFAELGARYNGFALTEHNSLVAAAIERIGQAVDETYISTEELSMSLGATFSEPMRESAQFASVVRSVLRYRVLKRVQQEMTKDDLERKKNLLDSLERSEIEAKRIDNYLATSVHGSPGPRRSTSTNSAKSNSNQQTTSQDSTEETQSVDSDFPPTHGDAPSSPPSSSQNLPYSPPTSPASHKKSQSGNFVTNKIFGSFRQAVNGFVDNDPERTRRDQIGKTKESLTHLEQALEVSEQDVKDATLGVIKDLVRFQKEKEEDIGKYMIAYARCHIEWAKKNVQTWTEARDEVAKIVTRD